MGRGVERRPAILVAGLNVAAVVDEELDHGAVVVGDGDVQRGVAVGVDRLDVGALFEQPRREGNVAVADGHEQREVD